MAKIFPRYDLARVKGDAQGHWHAIIERVAGIGDDYLTSNHGPCPKCGGNDRWRVFDDFEATGGAICNQCGKFGDGIAVVMWQLGIGFPEAVRRIAEFLGTTPEAASGRANGGVAGYTPPKVSGAKANGVPTPRAPVTSLPGSETTPPSLEFRTLEILDPMEPNDSLGLAMWCRAKGMMDASQAKELGARFGRYRSRYSVVAFPVIDPSGHQVGWTLYEKGGGMLPHFNKGSKEVAQWLKVKTIKVK